MDPRNSNLKFREIAQQWLDSNPKKWPTTWAADESQLRVHVLPVLGGRRLGSITRADVQRLVNEWNDRMRPRSVRRCYGVLRAVFAYALLNDYIGRSPRRGVNLPEVKRRETRALTPDDVATDAMPLEYRPMVWIGAMSGLRWGEVAALRVRRLDVLRSTVHVAETISRGKKGERHFGPPKSEAGVRTLAIPAALVEMLAEHLARRGLTGADVDALLLVAENGAPLDYSNWWRRVWLPAVKKAELGTVGFHDLRRANATSLVTSRVDLKTAQTRLGHSDPRLTLAVWFSDGSRTNRGLPGA